MAAQAGIGTGIEWKGGRNPLVEAVQAISIDGGGPQTPEEAELDAMRGEKVAERWEDDPRNPQSAAFQAARRSDATRVAVVSDDGEQHYPAWLVYGDDVASQNREGSYESLMSGWGVNKAFDTELATKEQ